jgi:hypothetical protein
MIAIATLLVGTRSLDPADNRMQLAWLGDGAVSTRNRDNLPLAVFDRDQLPKSADGLFSLLTYSKLWPFAAAKRSGVDAPCSSHKTR